MTKADIVNEITKNTGIDKVTVLTTLEAFMDTVKDSLSKRGKCVPAWFWKFCSKEKELRRLLAIFQRTLQSLFRSTIFRHLNQLRHLHYQ